ncbi:MAG: nucleotide sugar dehydrogenase [Bacteroidota bacterium]|nr:nucleotide sugar dehydrogenase [Bacteroidota bacterium]
MLNKLHAKENSIAVIGLGYVGLPIALEFARKFRVIGFDIKPERVEMLKNKQDPSFELEPEAFDGTDITFTANIEDLREAHFYIVAVPTPIDVHNQPDLRPLIGASHTVGKVLKQGDYVVYESTVYPGCTEEDCVPILEAESGLKFITDFKVGYSPERINPGDKEHTITNILKIVSGCDAESLEVVSDVYSTIVIPGTHKASSIKVAEAAKIIENTQRDLNIALMNELSLIFHRMNINTFDVLEAAGTKWNFLKFFPGMVGGHCIGVDPYYLTYKSNTLGYHAQIILAGRNTNDNMAAWVAGETIKLLSAKDKAAHQSRILVMGATFKENVADVRNSKVADLVKTLNEFRSTVHVVDPHASKEEFLHEYGIPMVDGPQGKYDAVIVTVPHREYLNLTQEDFKALLNEDTNILVDLKGIYRNKVDELTHWTL